ncbi:MAG: NUDIX domain-containing protein [Planctomycetota bacterium]|nr:NUDIX domain-containing protein [Planctomycetota bacterium]
MPQGNGTADDPVIAAGIVLWRAGQQGPEFLMLRNALHLSWGFPKGQLKKGESLQAGACREVLEETSVNLLPQDLHPDFADASLYQPMPTYWKRAVHFLAEIPTDTAIHLSDEHNELAWLTLPQAKSILKHQNLIRTLTLAAYLVVS